MAEFAINTHHVSSEAKDFAFALRSAWLESVLDPGLLRPKNGGNSGTLALVAQRSGGDILVQGCIKAELIAACFRCLEDATVELSADFSSLFCARDPQFRPPADEAELSPEELEKEFYSGEELVLDDYIRDQILLEAPLQPLCKEDCPGIPIPEHVRPPADFGEKTTQENPIDPRLAPLLKLNVKGSPSKE